MTGENLQVIFLILHIYPSECFYPIYPEQIHLSLGNSPLEMVVTWVTFRNTQNSFVWYGKISEGLTLRAAGNSKKFTTKKNSRVVRFVHKVVLTHLEPLHFYAYRCGSWYGASEPYVFKVSPEGTDWSPRLIIFGDMGWKGAEAFPYILNEAKDYDVDAIFHVGDIAYDMSSHDGFTGDRFMNMIQPLASSVPYMTCVGNHEQYQYVLKSPSVIKMQKPSRVFDVICTQVDQSPIHAGSEILNLVNGCWIVHPHQLNNEFFAFRNFSQYKNIFSMPGKSEGLFYSFNLGPVHFVVVSTEVYYFTQYGIEPLKRQYEWLQNDLEIASNERNRRRRPWIIVFGHRPMYCSSDDGEDCSLESSILRCCLLNSCNYGLEDLFHEYRVDLIFSGHMHYYERSWPIYNKRVYKGSCEEPYRNPGAAVHIITGAAGMKSGPESASYIREDWFPFFSNEYSYTILTVYNKSYIYLEQVSAARDGEVIDSAWFIKDL